MRLWFTDIHLPYYNVKWTVHDVIQKSWNKFSLCLLSLHFITVAPLNTYIQSSRKKLIVFFSLLLSLLLPLLELILLIQNRSTWANEAFATVGQLLYYWPFLGNTNVPYLSMWWNAGCFMLSAFLYVESDISSSASFGMLLAICIGC